MVPPLSLMHRYGLGSYAVVLQGGMICDWFSLGLLFYSVFRARGSVFVQRLSLHTPRAGHLLIYAICLTANIILSIHFYMVTFPAAMAILGLRAAGRQ
jgi:hypothetical protein